MHPYGRGSPRRGSRKRERWGVVALAVIETQKKRHTEINRAQKKPQPKIPLWKSIQHIYETPEILRSIFSTDSCLQSDNGVSTSNTRNGNWQQSINKVIWYSATCNQQSHMVRSGKKSTKSFGTCLATMTLLLLAPRPTSQRPPKSSPCRGDPVRRMVSRPSTQKPHCCSNR